MKLDYQFSSARIQCQKCRISLKNVEHPVLLQDEETRLDLCYPCFSSIQSDLQYLARWKHKGYPARKAREDENRLDKIACEMVDYFNASPSRFSLLYNLNVLKVLYLERLKVIKESRRTVKNGKLVLHYQLAGKEIHLLYEPFTEELLLQAAEEFAP